MAVQVHEVILNAVVDKLGLNGDPVRNGRHATKLLQLGNYVIQYLFAPVHALPIVGLLVEVGPAGRHHDAQVVLLLLPDLVLLETGDRGVPFRQDRLGQLRLKHGAVRVLQVLERVF